jgi:hypothetical protein
MFGPLPGHPHPAEGQSNRFVADLSRGEALGETDLGGQRERPPDTCANSDDRRS